MVRDAGSVSSHTKWMIIQFTIKLLIRTADTSRATRHCETQTRLGIKYMYIYMGIFLILRSFQDSIPTHIDTLFSSLISHDTPITACALFPTNAPRHQLRESIARHLDQTASRHL